TTLQIRALCSQICSATSYRAKSQKIADSLSYVIATETSVATPEIVRLFNLQEGKTYDWENINGLPALHERK
ncbi:MAG: hypothetical protein K8R34_07195, partial [Methanosarcinales archaeon]|nr:hypothetical protein [Methanosarcinales archaeon]